MKKKVLFITPSLCQGGIEHSLVTMLNLLDKEKYQLTVFTYREDITLLPLLPKEVEFINITQSPHYFRKPKAIALNAVKILSGKLKLKRINQKATLKLKEYIHNQKVKNPAKTVFKNRSFDTIVSNAIGLPTEMGLYIKADNRIVFYRASIDMHHELLTQLFPKYDRIVAVSNGVKDMLSDNYPHFKDKIFVLENYVDSQQIIAKANEMLQIDVSNDDKLILCTCGRFSEEKGFDMAVECA
ncbi:MAG: hypothetical protein IJU04_02425, partial [Ruminococcus sp.]|nr:hypothetical protein [Ruminococcus sp.]